MGTMSCNIVKTIMVMMKWAGKEYSKAMWVVSGGDVAFMYGGVVEEGFIIP
jgi:hypothetical protein